MSMQDDIFDIEEVLKGSMQEKQFEKIFRKKKMFTENKDYINYINSKAWKEKRKEKLSVQNCCEMCGNSESLHVHHNNYANFKNEKMEDLNVVCSKCHSDIHNGA